MEALEQVALLVVAAQERLEVAARLSFEVALWSIGHQLSSLVATQALEVEQVELQQEQRWAWVLAELVVCSHRNGKDRSHRHLEQVEMVALGEVRAVCPWTVCPAVVVAVLLWALPHEEVVEERSLVSHQRLCCRQDLAPEREP